MKYFVIIFLFLAACAAPLSKPNIADNGINIASKAAIPKDAKYCVAATKRNDPSLPWNKAGKLYHDYEPSIYNAVDHPCPFSGSSVKAFGDTIYVDGAIDRGIHYLYDEIIMFSKPRTKKFVLNSQGGNIAAAYMLVKLVNDHGITVVVPEGANCLSACVIVFMGAERRIAAKSSTFMIHNAHYSGLDEILYKQKLKEHGKQYADKWLADMTNGINNKTVAIMDFTVERGASPKVKTIFMAEYFGKKDAEWVFHGEEALRLGIATELLKK